MNKYLANIQHSSTSLERNTPAFQIPFTFESIWHFCLESILDFQWFFYDSKVKEYRSEIQIFLIKKAFYKATLQVLQIVFSNKIQILQNLTRKFVLPTKPWLTQRTPNDSTQKLLQFSLIYEPRRNLHQRPNKRNTGHKCLPRATLALFLSTRARHAVPKSFVYLFLIRVPWRLADPRCY